MHVVNPQTGESDPAEIRRVFDAQLATALAWRESTAAERIARLKKLRDGMMARREDFYSAFQKDYRKPSAEVEATEFMPVLDEIRHAIGSLKKWMKPKKVWPTIASAMTSSWIEYQPRGRSLIIAPWNFPLNLCFGPMVSALAAGNTVILKPSEMTPAVSAVMAEIIASLFKDDEVALFEGSLPTSQALLELPFDHIFFTGSPAVGKVVMSAAAKHLTSVTLELGGKSPVIVDETANLRLTAEALMWGKFTNCGQICVAPDHVYVHESVKEKLVDECKAVLAERYGVTPQEQRNSPHLARVINQRHTQRIAGLLQDAQGRGARVLTGGDVDVSTCYIAPTLIEQVPQEAQIMSEEIFGPVLPIITYRDLDSVVREINAQPKPLALYVFSTHKQRTRRLLAQTSSGGVAINHCVLHYAQGNLPFGGVNNSGIGNAHGHFGFKAFSHERAVLKSGPILMAKLFFPPYTNFKQKLIRATVDILRLPSIF
ncbi:MAG: aldehyde dehydrogenase family protein [Burkholderiales bacterium]|nr:aldehyde dehydrogenase family protein [Burkholderiales bacterium]MDE2075727.1 aldehyde dehydrogenase family protein [Burkholderiales bacterium]MDE2432544.1 aldehyde dehydrogenase family protein [Burkholderiales bacterium]